LPHRRVSDIAKFGEIFDSALGASGPCLIEIDMAAIGPFSQSFAGPPAGAAGQP
jgi:acetolactate synthase-1/2/3 large subunit